MVFYDYDVVRLATQDAFIARKFGVENGIFFARQLIQTRDVVERLENYGLRGRNQKVDGAVQFRLRDFPTKKK